jgi:hypothetical protein
MLLLPGNMADFVHFSRRFLIGSVVLAFFLVTPPRADAQGIGFQGGVTVDPEQAFVGTHFETGEIFQGLRFRPGIDGGFGGDYSTATINIEFLYHIQVGRSCSGGRTTTEAHTPARSSRSASRTKMDSSRTSSWEPAPRQR